jgi:hypothetical protein
MVAGGNAPSTVQLNEIISPSTTGLEGPFTLKNTGLTKKEKRKNKKNQDKFFEGQRVPIAMILCNKL